MNLGIQKWMENIRGYYDTGKIIVNLAFSLLTWTFFIGQSVHPVEEKVIG